VSAIMFALTIPFLFLVPGKARARKSASAAAATRAAA
jgi:hypothetical protein